MSLFSRIRMWEFHARIFISLAIVLFVCLLSYAVFQYPFSNAVLIGKLIGLGRAASVTAGFLFAALIIMVASLLRMWAGSLLSSQRVMSFRVRSDALVIRGPYVLVRNPIYLSDISAMIGFTLCLPPAGILLPALLLTHYFQLVMHEETSLGTQFSKEYSEYALVTPRLLPTWRSWRNFLSQWERPQINRDGVRNNALYLLFIPGFLVASLTGEFFHAVLIGLPAVFDWAMIHTRKGLPKQQVSPSGNGQRTRRKKKKKVFEDILYAQCWEDPSLDRKAMNIRKDDVVFSITSGGCNTLTFLLDDPKKVYALDMNPHQNYLLELKIAGFKSLTYDELLEFVGVRESDHRAELYRRLRSQLSDVCRAYWDGEQDKIAGGIIHAGRFEAYMKLLRSWLWRTIGRTTIQQFFESHSPSWRLRLYHERWEGFWWWLFTRVLLSRWVMTLLFDKAFFQYLDASFSFGENFAKKIQHALTQLPMRENYFISYILLGTYYSEQHLPPYLRREHFETIRRRVSRVDIITNSCEKFFESLPDNTISKFNFTNIFEWMSESAYEKLLHDTVRVATDGAIMTYRNLLVHRERPESRANGIVPNGALARLLHEQDLSFIYDNYVVEQIQKGDVKWTTRSEQSTIEQR